jgi:hypothetical protein
MTPASAASATSETSAAPASGTAAMAGGKDATEDNWVRAVTGAVRGDLVSYRV